MMKIVKLQLLYNDLIGWIKKDDDSTIKSLGKKKRK